MPSNWCLSASVYSCLNGNLNIYDVYLRDVTPEAEIFAAQSYGTDTIIIGVDSDVYSYADCDFARRVFASWVRQTAGRLVDWPALPEGFYWPENVRIYIKTGDYLVAPAGTPEPQYYSSYRDAVAAAVQQSRSNYYFITLGKQRDGQWFAPHESYIFKYDVELAGEVVYATSTNRDITSSELSNACSNCGFMGHNSATCEVLQPHSFLKVGIEIEGRWVNARNVEDRALAAGLGATGDASIRRSPDNLNCTRHEFQTKPGTLRQAISQLLDFYPDETDSSCGMHVHVSYPNTDLTLFYTDEFMVYARSRWETWGAKNGLDPNSQFFRRLRGENDYCNVNSIDEDRSMEANDRYQQYNFASWEKHETLECRLLPMFRRASLGVSAVIELVSIYEDWLNSAHKFVLTLPEASVYVQQLQDEFSDRSGSYFHELDLDDVVKFNQSSVVIDLPIAEIEPPRAGYVRVQANMVNQYI